MIDQIPAERPIPSARLAIRREHLVAEVARSVPRHRVGLTRLIAGAGVGVLAVGGGVGAAAAAGVFDGGGAAVSTSIACADSADIRHSDLAVINSSDQDPRVACRALWERGELVSGRHSAPLLTSCLMTSGVLVVVPGKPGTCQEHGLQAAHSASAEQRRTAIAVRTVRDRLVSEIASSCHTEAQAAGYARRALADQGLVGWTLKEVHPSGPGDSCAAFSIDQAHQRVVIVGQAGV